MHAWFRRLGTTARPVVAGRCGVDAEAGDARHPETHWRGRSSDAVARRQLIAGNGGPDARASGQRRDTVHADAAQPVGGTRTYAVRPVASRLIDVLDNHRAILRVLLRRARRHIVNAGAFPPGSSWQSHSIDA